MGYSISFQRSDQPLGHVSFSNWTQERQEKAYGLGWFDCITYGPEGEGEVIGPPGEDVLSGWYQPDWNRALARVRKLWTAVQATEDPHRKEYDTDKVRELHRLMEYCADPDRRNDCYLDVG